MRIPPNEHDLHAYVDNQLNDHERAIIERYIAQQPQIARQVQTWQWEARHLRTALSEFQLPLLPERLDPAFIRARHVQRSRLRLKLAACFVLCVGLSSAGGWQMHDWRNQNVAPMGDAIEAYKLMVVDGSIGADVVQHQPDTLNNWLNQHVGSDARLPDLQSAGFSPVSGRLFATEQGAAAMVLYQDTSGHTISFYLRQPDSRHPLLKSGQRTDHGLQARYGSCHGLNYAMVGTVKNLSNPKLELIINTLT
ncbi:anti-sigma factor [Pantoea sp. Al-1710]|uniref:Anti-sigma factor n=1 Tax=Candidatus Pantoea communis TaxID=2608354 RepID=A0ABX0RQ97_9GAMM|nr:anti-sigma factor [Pantoea communis]NIG19264.1 anti-sigma factor [Pantoea communis]